MMLRKYSAVGAWLLALSAGLHGADDCERVLVGVNYFAGWWESLPNKWHGNGWAAGEPDWRPKFPERVPLLGCYNDQPTMDREIAAAASHSVDFFSILWYFPRPGSAHEAQGKLLNRGVGNFLSSTNAVVMKFMIEYCNEPAFSATTDDEWNACVKTWVAAMRHPGYLRVDGRLVFKIHGADQFLKGNDRDLERCRQQLNSLRDAARAAGLGEMIVGGGIMSRSQVKAAHPVAKLFDFTATYMSVPGTEESGAESVSKDYAKVLAMEADVTGLPGNGREEWDGQHATDASIAAGQAVGANRPCRHRA